VAQRRDSSEKRDEVAQRREKSEKRKLREGRDKIFP
jgi:hypothetical protein